jgi:hypothetical protein
MSNTAIAVPDVPHFVLPRAQAETPPREEIRPRHPGSGRGLWGWAKEALLLVGAVYMFPIAILAIGIPIAFAVNGLLLLAGWAWKAL